MLLSLPNPHPFVSIATLGLLAQCPSCPQICCLNERQRTPGDSCMHLHLLFAAAKGPRLLYPFPACCFKSPLIATCLRLPLPAARGALEVGWPPSAPSCSSGRQWGQRWQLWWGLSRPGPPKEVSVSQYSQRV